MNDLRKEAEQIYFEARNLRQSDAISLIEARLMLLFAKGEKTGIEAARQSINQLGRVELQAAE